jgi:hypothetical protein
MCAASSELLGGGVGTFPVRSIIEGDLKLPSDCVNIGYSSVQISFGSRMAYLHAVHNSAARF